MAEPPCREADRASVECPECQRFVQLRWLRYGHVCGRTWNAQQRAVEEIPRAEQQFRGRVEPQAKAAAPATNPWSHLIANAF